VRPIAVIKATQTEKSEAVRNDRIIGLALSKETPLELQNVQFDKHTVSQIGFFFSSYNKLYGKKFKVIGTGSKHKAGQLIDLAIKRCRKEKSDD
jgi:inorganic pyrophosphatase